MRAGHSARALTTCLVALAVGSSACAGAPKNRYVHRAGSGPVEVLEGPAPWDQHSEAMTTRVANAVREAYRTRKVPAAIETIEGRDRELREALLALSEHVDADAHLRVGWAYRQASVADRAFDHFDSALRLDSRLAAAYDGRARTWRDWGFAGLALSDSARAVFYAPESAAVHNTLGTVLLALGNCTAARRSFVRAVALDDHATYAHDNLDLVGALEVGASGGCRVAPHR